MAQALLDREPSSYLLYLPDNTFVSSEGSDYWIWGGSFADRYVNDGTGTLFQGRINLQLQDPFSQGAVARLATGLRYVRMGNVWLRVPIPAVIPVVLAEQVYGTQEYRVIQQIPYTGGRPVINPLVIPFNISISCATAGNFAGANELVFASLPSGTVKEKISLSVDVLTADPGNANLKYSSQINAPRTKGQLAQAVAREVEKALAPQKHAFLAFLNHIFVQELSFEDLFLVDLVRMSQSTYRPTIALRVRA